MRLSSLLRKITVCSALALLPALTIVPIRPAQAADLTYVEAGSYLTEEDLTASPDTMASPALGTDPADPPGADVPLLTPVDLSLPDEAPDTPDASGVHDLLPDDAGGTEGADASSSQMAAAATSTVIGASGNGIGYTGYEPPDPTIAAGPTRLVLAVNARLASYTKTDPPSKEWSIPFSKWVPSKAWSAGLIYTDPWVVYDTADDRFFFVVLGADSFKDPTKSYLIVGTSPSSSSNGTWCVHHFGFQSGMLPDYPKLGYNADRLYVTANRYQFQNGKRAFLGASLITIPKNPLLSCNNVSAKRFSGLTNLDGSLAFSIQPPTRGRSVPERN